MLSIEERIARNLLTIRDYLKRKFPGYGITEQSVHGLYHSFTVMNEDRRKNYRLKVPWSRLAGRRNTPGRIRLSLDRGLVASEMVRAGNDHYSW